MPNILVLYDSATENTARMAEFVADGCRQMSSVEVRVRTVDNAAPADILWCHGIAVGAPTNMGLLSWKMKKFWDDLGDELWGKVDGKLGCAFSSSVGWGGGAELTCQSILTVLVNFGFLVFGLPDYVGKQLTLHYGAVIAGEPRTEQEREACRRLGKRLALWVSMMTDRTGPVLSDDVHNRGRIP